MMMMIRIYISVSSLSFYVILHGLIGIEESQ